jgi:hypothetical protein
MNASMAASASVANGIVAALDLLIVAGIKQESQNYKS